MTQLSYKNPFGDRISVNKDALLELGSGNEGTFYLIRKSGFGVKILSRPSINTCEKVELFVESPKYRQIREAKWISTPQAILKENKSFCGYVANAFQDHTSLLDLLRDQCGSNMDRNRGVTLIAALFSHLTVLHEADVIIGDLQPANILIPRDFNLNQSGFNEIVKAPKFIDVDSYQIEKNGRTFKCEVGSDHYSSAKVLRQAKSSGSGFSVARQKSDDVYAMAVIAFRVLNRNYHPMGQKGLSVVDAIKVGKFPYNRSTPNLPNRGSTNQFTALPSEIRRFFIDVFENKRFYSAYEAGSVFAKHADEPKVRKTASKTTKVTVKTTASKPSYSPPKQTIHKTNIKRDKTLWTKVKAWFESNGKDFAVKLLKLLWQVALVLGAIGVGLLLLWWALNFLFVVFVIVVIIGIVGALSN